MKLIVSIEFAAALESRLPTDVQVVWVDHEGNLDGNASNAEVYLSAGLLKPSVLDKILNAAPALRWQHTPSAGVNHLLTPTALARDLILTNGAGVHGVPIRSQNLCLLLCSITSSICESFTNSKNNSTGNGTLDFKNC